MDEEFTFEKNFGEMGENGGAVGVYTTVAECTLHILKGEEDFEFGEISARKVLEIAGQFIAAGSASPTGSVGEPESSTRLLDTLKV